MKRKIYLYGVFLLNLCFYMHPDELGDVWQNIKSKTKETWHGAVGMAKGMAQGFGVIPPEFRYSYIVFNDAADDVIVVEFQLTNIMGARFSGKINKHQVLPPMTNSGNAFYNRHLYFSIFICTSKKPGAVFKYGQSAKEWAKWGAVAGIVGGPLIPLTVPLGAAIGALAGGEKQLASLKEYKILQDTVYPWAPHDKNIYFYRAYTDKGKLKGEFLDVKSVNDKFAGQFYNSTDRDVKLQFIKDNKTYEVTLEKHSFNSLNSSDEQNSIRPPKGTDRGFTFFEKQKQFAYIPIQSEGIAYLAPPEEGKTLQPKKGEMLPAGVPMLYTYEVYELDGKLSIGLQGLAMGKYDQPVTRARDINPVHCSVWFKSAEQVLQEQKQEGVNYTTRPIDFFEDIWISYKGDIGGYEETIKPGEIKNFTIIRPTLALNKAQLYIVSIPTAKYNYATSFFQKLHGGYFKQANLYEKVDNPLDPKEIEKMLNTPLHGIVEDKDLGVYAAVKLVDTFYPQGVGSGPFYYIVEPDILRIDQFANIIAYDSAWYAKNPGTGALELKPEILKELYDKLPEWIKLYLTDPDKAANELKGYLGKYGNSGLFEKGTKEFNAQGKIQFQGLLDGPISLKNYPIMRKGGLNYYVFGFGKKPENWPGAKDEPAKS